MLVRCCNFLIRKVAPNDLVTRYFFSHVDVKNPLVAHEPLSKLLTIDVFDEIFLQALAPGENRSVEHMSDVEHTVEHTVLLFISIG